MSRAVLNAISSIGPLHLMTDSLELSCYSSFVRSLRGVIVMLRSAFNVVILAGALAVPVLIGQSANAQTYDLVANKVILSDHTSWIENLTYDTSTGLKFNEKRKSYRLNKQGEKTYLRAEYFYSNYSVTY